MVDVDLATTDGRHLTLPRHTQPTRDHRLLLDQLKLRLPEQPPPLISVQTPPRLPSERHLVVPTFDFDKRKSIGCDRSGAELRKSG